MLNALTCNKKKSAQEQVLNSLHIKEITVYNDKTSLYKESLTSDKEHCTS